MANVIEYHYRGLVERIGTNPNKVRLSPGYSETTDDGGVLYPWMTRKECQDEAKSREATAKFV